MTEIKALMLGRPVKYSGLFDLKELYKVIDTWCKDHQYDKIERDNHEDVTLDGKQIILKLVPYKKLTDYAKVEITINATFSNCKEEEVTHGKFKKKMLHGEASLSFDCLLFTDYEGNWETKPIYFFFRTMVDKFLYKGYTKRYEQTALDDVNEIISEVKSYLNMQRYR